MGGGGNQWPPSAVIPLVRTDRRAPSVNSFLIDSALEGALKKWYGISDRFERSWRFGIAKLLGTKLALSPLLFGLPTQNRQSTGDSGTSVGSVVAIGFA